MIRVAETASTAPTSHWRRVNAAGSGAGGGAAAVSFLATALTVIRRGAERIVLEDDDVLRWAVRRARVR